jgi:hypothetical protein
VVLTCEPNVLTSGSPVSNLNIRPRLFCVYHETINFFQFYICRKKFPRTPGGTYTPGWIPLVWGNSLIYLQISSILCSAVSVWVDSQMGLGWKAACCPTRKEGAVVFFWSVRKYLPHFTTSQSRTVVFRLDYAYPLPPRGTRKHRMHVKLGEKKYFLINTK